MGHDHAHHHHAPRDFGRAFKLGIGLNLAYVGIEAGYGLVVGSLALVADAGHNLSDVAGLVLAYGATLLAGKKPTQRRTYGLRRATILAALASAILLLVVLGGLTLEALRRLTDPAEVSGKTVIIVAAIGVVINTATALLFASGRDSDLNIRGAYLHMVADAGVSLGVVLAGAGMLWTSWTWLDPAISLAIVVVVLISTWSLLRDSADLAMDAVPQGIDPVEVEHFLLDVPGVAALHDLHIWGLSTTEAALTAHLVVPEKAVGDEFLHEVGRELHDRFGIEHATLQVERGDPRYDCDGCEQAVG
ncbi:MAG: cation transporter [bacterium]|nr:cation transporter [bacterium]